MSKLDNATTSRIESERTKVDVVAGIASFVDALACLIGYWGFHRRLHDTEAILADIALTFLVLFDQRFLVITTGRRAQPDWMPANTWRLARSLLEDRPANVLLAGILTD